MLLRIASADDPTCDGAAVKNTATALTRALATALGCHIYKSLLDLDLVQEHRHSMWVPDRVLIIHDGVSYTLETC